MLCTLLWLTFSSVHPQSVLTIGSTTVVADTVVTNIDVPWEILYGPDKHIWMTERKGIVSRIDPLLKTKTPVLNLTASVYYYAEAGLLGMALHPDFATVQEVFLVYTYLSNSVQLEKLVKYTWNGTALINEQILIDSITANSFHDGSRLLFLPDKTLLMTTGEAGNTSLSQNMSSLNGKVLRLNPDGSIPADNPFPGSYIYTLGHRNPQGLTLGPDGKIYISEHGPSNDDEFQELEMGRNYGWPNVEGFCNLPAEITYCTANNIKEPIVNWSPTIAPSDLVYYANSSFPEFNGCFLMSVLKNKKVVAIKLDGTGTTYISQASYLNNMFGRLRDICVGPDQEIYLATNGANSFNTDPNTHSLLVLRPPVSPVEIIKIKNDPEIRIYPTLVKETININLRQKEKTTGSYVLTLTDLSGRICREEVFVSTAYSCNLSTLENGLYFLTIACENKIIKQGKIIITE